MYAAAQLSIVLNLKTESEHFNVSVFLHQALSNSNCLYQVLYRMLSLIKDEIINECNKFIKNLTEFTNMKFFLKAYNENLKDINEYSLKICNNYQLNKKLMTDLLNKTSVAVESGQTHWFEMSWF